MSRFINRGAGKAMKDMTPKELQQLEDARIANSIWLKSKAGKEYKANIADLTPKEKLANARNIAREYGRTVIEPKKVQMLETRAQELERRDAEQERKEAKSERDYIQETRRLEAEAKARNKKSVWDSLANEIIGVLPVPGIVKTIGKEAYSQVSNKLQGKGMGERHASAAEDGYELHAVKISNTLPIEEAIRLSKEFIKGPKNFYKESKNYYKFRNIAKTKFIKSSYRTKKVNKDIQLIYGKLK